MEREKVVVTTKDVGRVSAADLVGGKPTVGDPGAAPHIAAATGVAVKMSAGSKAVGKLMEAAMSQAILDASSEGITDPVQIKERMMAAQRRARDEFQAAEAAEASAPVK